ncbi:MAG: HD domain-containing protein [Fuerstiella sp.]|jgi:hypothetical protein|nr:HD domain-containing protein [Fuerstiella sp.]MCP4509138.1 HD domain-containing protein [Fuerstiella sp.]MDG2127451.1 hypothetical protein [Fuerstiella sp.]
MNSNKLRRRICFDAAQLLHSRRETSFRTAKWHATRAITRSYVAPESVPTDMEIRVALQQLVSTAVPIDNSEDATELGSDISVSRFDRYYSLLEPLDRVRLNRGTHPEGDLLYHSLQVFELAREARPWDEEFMTAALLHDVGKGIDPFDAETATLKALNGIVWERTLWFVENLPTQHRLYDGTIGVRARRRLSRHEDGEELTVLAKCDRDGRVPGRRVSKLDEAIDFVKSLALENSGQSSQPG